MPEVPENMQHNLAHLEQQAQRPAQYNHSMPAQHDQQRLRAQYTANGQYEDQIHYSRAQGQGQYSGGEYNHDQHNYGQAPSFEPIEQPNFSRFPVLRNLPPNVPPTAEQKEASLEAARLPVLGSNDPLNQLDWAQDALAYVEEAVQNEQRMGSTASGDIRLSHVQQLLKDDAIKVIMFLASQEHPRALVLKGIWLEFGKFDFAIDKRQSWECYKTAARNAVTLGNNDPAKNWGGRAQYRIGMQFENSKDTVNALKHFQLGVDAGDSAACYRLGMMVLLGQHGQPQDFQRGLSLIFTAAQKADENAPQGAYVFGMLQARELAQVNIPDLFLSKDINAARINIERAAFLGFAKAQVRMGAAYELCELGCDFNPALSLHYNNLAARQGEPEAEMAISKWFLAGHEGVFDKDEEMAFTYAQRAAQDGLPTAQFAIGYFHEIGIFVDVNLHLANDWYRKAAANGNTDAAGRIDCLSRSKTLSRKDHEKVALSKIKESRLQSPTEPAHPMPAMPALLDMPDPTRLSLSSPINTASDQYGQQHRQSVVPYPANNDFGSSRPAMSSHSSNMSNPEIRPGSAFGINPNLRPSSAATIAGTRPDHNSRPGFQDQGRRYSAINNGGGAGYGRGDRIVSSSAQQGYAGPGRGGLPHDQRASPQIPSKVDIGFLAPLDSAAADRRNRMQTADNPSMGKPLPMVKSNVPPNMRQQMTPNSTHSPGMASSQRPSQRESMPQKPLPQQNRPASAAASRPPPAAAQRPTPTTAKPPAAIRPHGKGPKTFEEMGVPAGKGKDDCVSIALLVKTGCLADKGLGRYVIPTALWLHLLYFTRHCDGVKAQSFLHDGLNLTSIRICWILRKSWAKMVHAWKFRDVRRVSQLYHITRHSPRYCSTAAACTSPPDHIYTCFSI
jgi:TPR repeat protein